MPFSWGRNRLGSGSRKNVFSIWSQSTFSTFRNRNLEKTDFSHKLHYVTHYLKKKFLKKKFGNRVNLKKLFGTYAFFRVKRFKQKKYNKNRHCTVHNFRTKNPICIIFWSTDRELKTDLNVLKSLFLGFRLYVEISKKRQKIIIFCTQTQITFLRLKCPI